jgi:hypothetical protein
LPRAVTAVLVRVQGEEPTTVGSAMLTFFEDKSFPSYVADPTPLMVPQTPAIMRSVEALLRKRERAAAADHLAKIPFHFRSASFDYDHGAYILHAVVPLGTYETLRTSAAPADFGEVAEVLDELGYRVIRIAVEMELVPLAKSHGRSSLAEVQIKRLVYKYIGVNGGYLGVPVPFSYRTHAEFYVDLDLDIDPYKYPGTTKERFIAILNAQNAVTQARILEGVLKRFPAKDDAHKSLAVEIEGWIAELRNVEQVELPDLEITSDVVERALADADNLIRMQGATSGVDRVHTALHGYLRQLCADGGVTVTTDADAPALLAQLRKHHPALRDLVPRGEDTLAVLNASAVVVGKLSPIRNRHSLAHPSAVLLDEPEAMFVINSTRTILRYLDEKIRRAKAAVAKDPAPAPADDYARFDDDIPF